jgi:hypothetical protein
MVKGMIVEIPWCEGANAGAETDGDARQLGLFGG